MANDVTFIVVEGRVYRHDTATTETDLVCECSEEIEGAADEIAKALNRLPAAEALLVAVVGAIREFDEPSIALTEQADKIEEWMCS